MTIQHCTKQPSGYQSGSLISSPLFNNERTTHNPMVLCRFSLYVLRNGHYTLDYFVE
jgi:hypothetical protein